MLPISLFVIIPLVILFGILTFLPLLAITPEKDES